MYVYMSCEGKCQALISRYQTTKTALTVVVCQSVDRRKQYELLNNSSPLGTMSSMYNRVHLSDHTTPTSTRITSLMPTDCIVLSQIHCNELKIYIFNWLKTTKRAVTVNVYFQIWSQQTHLRPTWRTCEVSRPTLGLYLANLWQKCCHSVRNNAV